MVMSGWRIYNASSIFGDFEFPKRLTLGGWLGGALLWHFAAMWLLVVNGSAYLVLGLLKDQMGNMSKLGNDSAPHS
jgi:thiosulfate reductase cytochrome b subunit